MDLPSLAVVLQAALSPNPDERKAAEQSLNQVTDHCFTDHLGGFGLFEIRFLGILIVSFCGVWCLFAFSNGDVIRSCEFV